VECQFTPQPNIFPLHGKMHEAKWTIRWGTLLLSFSTDTDSWNQWWCSTGTRQFLKLLSYVLCLASFQFEIYFMWPSNFSDSFVFCSRLFCFILQTSECFRWMSLTYNHSVDATVCWNAVTSVKNINSCWPQKFTVTVSFLWSTVRCAQITTKKWSLP